MSWTTSREVNAQIARLWDRGDLARALVTGEAGLPRRLRLKGPEVSEVTDRFDAVRQWVSEISAIPGLRIVWRYARHRVHGTQRLPQEIWIDTPEAALALIGKKHDAATIGQLVTLTRSECPALLPWLANRPLRALDLAEQWPRLLAVVRWAMRHPRPGLYLRQVDVDGVHSKFIEAHRGVLSELLDLALPPESRVAGSAFEARYGFLTKPLRIRFRVLDDRLRILPGTRQADLSLDVENFAQLDRPIRRVFVTENETNFLAFPAIADSIVIFGSGYGWDALGRAAWLARCSMHYWGDIDTHGVAILDQLRRQFGHASSFLMDRETLDAHAAHWDTEPNPLRHDLMHLTADERAVFDDLRYNRIRDSLRLEQERIGFRWVTRCVDRVLRVSA
jgi:hypothetical protein